MRDRLIVRTSAHIITHTPQRMVHETITMPIDNCEHTFETLASAVLPHHFERLLAAMKRPIPASSLIGAKSASKAALKILGQDADFSGCYVFLEDTQPIYVGISRRVVRRLIQHLNTDTHFSASLVYRMASKDNPHNEARAGDERRSVSTGFLPSSEGLTGNP